jgi:hypothetical protein
VTRVLSPDPRSDEDSDAFSASGPGAAAGGAIPFSAMDPPATLAESSSQFLRSFSITDRTHGTVMDAQIPAQRKGTPHPSFLSVNEDLERE